MNSTSFRVSKILEVIKDDRGQSQLKILPGGYGPIVSSASNDYAVEPNPGDYLVIQEQTEPLVTLSGDAFEKYSYAEGEYLATKVKEVLATSPKELGKIVCLTTAKPNHFRRICLPHQVISKLGIEKGGYLVIHPGLLLSYCDEDTFEACSDKIINPS